jgi:hypothetical protein
MNEAARQDAWREVGIVGMYQAVKDAANGAQEAWALKGLPVTVEAMQEYYWCTWCTACCKRRQASNHRKLHWRAWGGLADPAKKVDVYEGLNIKYGEVLHLYRPIYMWCSGVTTKEAALLCILFVTNQIVHVHIHARASERMHAHWPLGAACSVHTLMNEAHTTADACFT